MASKPLDVCFALVLWVYLASTGHSEIPQLLLSGGGSSCAGRVEVLMDGVWGSVCDGGWDALDAEVTCRHMNCGSALAAYRGSYYGSGPSKTHLHEVQCNGSEQFLWECESDRRHYCTAGEHAGVLCTGHREVRLSGGRHNCSGRVEVFKDGVWMTVCDSHWYPADSEMLFFSNVLLWLPLLVECVVTAFWTSVKLATHDCVAY
ncbi:T-cell differentiation antigen CD6-like [Gastrophryne carolinensis]